MPLMAFDDCWEQLRLCLETGRCTTKTTCSRQVLIVEQLSRLPPALAPSEPNRCRVIPHAAQQNDRMKATGNTDVWMPRARFCTQSFLPRDMRSPTTPPPHRRRGHPSPEAHTAPGSARAARNHPPECSAQAGRGEARRTAFGDLVRRLNLSKST